MTNAVRVFDPASGQHRFLAPKNLARQVRRGLIVTRGQRYEFAGHFHTNSRRAELDASLDRTVTVGLGTDDQISGTFKCDSSRLLALGSSTWRQWPFNPPPHPSPTQNLDNNELGSNRSERLKSRRRLMQDTGAGLATGKASANLAVGTLLA